MTLRSFRCDWCATLLGATFITFLTAGCARPPAAEEEPPPAPVKAVAGRALLLGGWTELLGSTLPLPNQIARISTSVEGRVVAVPGYGAAKDMKEGQEVHAGDIVAQLDDLIIRQNVDKAEAGVRDLEEQQKQADIVVKLADLAWNSKLVLKQTVPKGGATQLEIEQAQLALDDARSKQKSIVAKLAIGQADLKIFKEQLRYYALRSPISGRLGIVQIVPGQVPPVGTLVAEVVNLDNIDVLSFVPPYVAAQLVLDQPARIVREEDPDDASAPQGKVVFIAPQAQADTGNIAVKVRFPNPDLKIRSNTVARVQVQIKPEQERLTIPETGLLEDQDPPAVILVENIETKKNAEGKEEKIGKARKLQAKVGIRDRRWKVVEILGLEDPEKKQTVSLQDALFVVEGGHGLQDGDVVKLDEGEEEEK